MKETQQRLMVNKGRNSDFEKAHTTLSKMKFESVEVSDDELDEAWDKLKTANRTPSKIASINVGSYLVAAAISIFLLSVFVINNQLNFDDNQTVLSEKVEKRTLAGQKLTFKLPDGSKVILNAGSSLSYQQGFLSTDQRIVHLEGEAFFDIIHDKDKPFKVITSDVETKVLGTVFNVTAYPGMSDTKVSLVKGSVAVSNASKSFKLSPGHQAIVSKENGGFEIKEFDEVQLGWKDGVIIFDHSDFDVLVQKLERWYGVDIEVAPGTIDPNWSFHGKFKGKSLSYILKAVSYPDQFQYEIQTNKVKIYERENK